MPLDVSVLLATRNRAALLRDTLARLAELDTSGLDWEVIAIDNGSSDDTPRVLEDMARILPLQALHEPRAGKNIALNRGLALARGELLLFTDDDVLAQRGWLQAHVGAARRWPAASIFAGRILLRFPAGTPEHLKLHEPVRSLLCEFVPPLPEGPTPQLPLGANFSVRSRAMQGIRLDDGIGPQEGRNYAMGSETELLKRLREQGHTIVYVPDAAIEHVVQPNQLEISWLLGRSYRLGRGLTRMGFAYGDPSPRVLGVPLRVWRQLAHTQLRYSLSRFFSWPREFDIACEYQRLRGAIFELRQMARERRESPTG
jgi:glycosyltransferase involved in cell wall biosynthesis